MPTDQFDVVLQPQSIVEKTVAGDFRTPIGQNQVLLNGKLVGYIGDKPTSPLNLIVRLPAAVVKRVQDQVASLRNTPTVAGGTPPNPDEVRKIIEDQRRAENQDLGDDDDDDESEEGNDRFDAVG